MGLWFGALCVVIFARATLNHYYRRAHPAAAESPRWGRRFTLGAFATGILWGIAAILLYRTESVPARMLLAFVLPGLAASGIATLGSLIAAYRAFVLPLVGFFVVYLFVAGGTTEAAIAAASLAFAIVLIVAAARYSRSIEQALTLRFENFVLLDSLSASKERLERFSTRLSREVSERGQAENLVREQGRRLAHYIEQTPLAVLEADLQYRIVAWNPAAERMFGYRRAEVLGKNALETLIPRDVQPTAQAFVAELMGGRHAGTGVLQLLTRDGRLMEGEWHVSTLRDEAGKVIGIAAAVQDITERKHLERMKNEFITTVSQELHSPLAAMRTAIGTLINGGAGPIEPRALKLIRTVQEHCERLASLTEAMLDAERMEALPDGLMLQPVSLAELARRAVADCQALAEQREIRVGFVEPAPEALVAGDPERLLKVFSNLINNAIKFSPEGGRVRVSLAADEAFVRLSIADRGTGVSNEFQARLMRKFCVIDGQPAKSTGDISLGLFVVKRMLEKQGGKFAIESFHNIGNAFHIELPRFLPVAA